jgi:hypothetical protein
MAPRTVAATASEAIVINENIEAKRFISHLAPRLCREQRRVACVRVVSQSIRAT